MGPTPRKSLALQEGRITLPGVTSVLGRSDATTVASLAGPAASTVTLVPLVVVEQADVTVTRRGSQMRLRWHPRGWCILCPRRPK